jgi:pimeloyl-ACP methyl ester carboxylesterase
VVDAAKTMTTPLLVVHDQGDREVPWRVGVDIAAAWPGAELHSTNELGHYRVLRDPGVVARVLGFLSA